MKKSCDIDSTFTAKHQSAKLGRICRFLLFLVRFTSAVTNMRRCLWFRLYVFFCGRTCFTLYVKKKI